MIGGERFEKEGVSNRTRYCESGNLGLVVGMFYLAIYIWSYLCTICFVSLASLGKAEAPLLPPLSTHLTGSGVLMSGVLMCGLFEGDL